MLIAIAGIVPLAGTAAATPPPSLRPTRRRRATTTGTAAAEPVNLDTNGDGTVVIGVATPGPRDDGGYYQAMVDGITQLSGGERLRRADHRRQRRPGAGGDRAAQPRSPERRRHRRRRRRAVRSAGGALGGVRRHLLVLQLRRRSRRRAGHRAGARRLVADQLHRRVRHRVVAPGHRLDIGGVPRLLRPRLRARGVPRLRGRAAGGRRLVHGDLHPDRRLQRRRRGDRGVQPGGRRRRRRRVPVPRRIAGGGRRARQRGRHHHDGPGTGRCVRARGAELPDRRACSTPGST